jgi:hypothetical protein
MVTGHCDVCNWDSRHWIPTVHRGLSERPSNIRVLLSDKLIFKITFLSSYFMELYNHLSVIYNIKLKKLYFLMKFHD